MNDALRMVDVKSGIVSTFQREGLHHPREVICSLSNKYFIVLNDNFLASLNLRTRKISTLTGRSTSGHMDGSFQNALFHIPSSIQPLTERIYMIADNKNNRLRVIDAETECVYSICTGEPFKVLGDMKNCAIKSPATLLYTEGQLYIGVSGYIFKMEGMCE